MKLCLITFLLLSSLLLGGCFQIPSQKKPAVVIPNDKSHYTPSQLNADYDIYQKHLDRGRIQQATDTRDRMIQKIRIEIDYWYYQLEEDMYEQRAGFNTATDIFELGLAGAATLTNGVRAKTVLATILTGEKGSRLSYDKNWFREKTTEVLMSAMRTERARLLTSITGKMTSSNAQQYKFDEARADLLAYFEAGTVQGGLLALSITTGQQADQAKKAEDAQTQVRIESLQDETVKIRALTKTLKNITAEETRKILDALKITYAEHASTEDLVRLLQDEIRKLKPDDDKALQKLSDAFKQAKGTP